MTRTAEDGGASSGADGEPVGSEEAAIREAITRRTGDTPRERATRGFFFACAALSIVTTLSIAALLFYEAARFFRTTGTLLGVPAEQTVPVAEFLLGTTWAPAFSPRSFGVLPLVADTLVITIGAAIISLPLGTATAIYLSEYAGERRRAYLKPALEVLAGVPTVIYGIFALVYITPALGVVVPGIERFNALSASIVVGIMIVPMVSSISEDAMSAVPDSLRQAAYGMGATKFDVSVGVVVPAAISGISSSFILALSRAIGETMAVTVAAGATPNLPDGGAFVLENLPLLGTLSVPFPTLETPAIYTESIMPMTAAMVNLAMGDLPTSGAPYQSLFAVGATLFVLTLAMNVVSDLIAARYREEYE